MSESEKIVKGSLVGKVGGQKIEGSCVVEVDGEETKGGIALEQVEIILKGLPNEKKPLNHANDGSINFVAKIRFVVSQEDEYSARMLMEADSKGLKFENLKLYHIDKAHDTGELFALEVIEFGSDCEAIRIKSQGQVEGKPGLEFVMEFDKTVMYSKNLSNEKKDGKKQKGNIAYKLSCDR